MKVQVVCGDGRTAVEIPCLGTCGAALLCATAAAADGMVVVVVR